MPVAAHTQAEFEARFWAKVDKNQDCWIWTGGQTPAGYGSLTRDQKRLYAHRVSYELANGPLGAGVCVLHKCDNPPCVNPAHLFDGSKADNAQDCARKLRGNARPDSPTKRLTAAQVRKIRERYAAGGISQKRLAVQFGVAQMTVSQIIRRKTWAYLD